jgi:hypothetical protein
MPEIMVRVRRLHPRVGRHHGAGFPLVRSHGPVASSSKRSNGGRIRNFLH